MLGRPFYTWQDIIIAIKKISNSIGLLNDYSDRDTKELHKYGIGPFCKFRIPTSYEDKIGVYLLFSDQSINYVGETDNLAKRYNLGYGQISPRNCFVGGQPTNCRINHAILNEIKKGKTVKLFFRETNDRFNLESFLIERLRQSGIG